MPPVALTENECSELQPATDEEFAGKVKVNSYIYMKTCFTTAKRNWQKNY